MRPGAEDGKLASFGAELTTPALLEGDALEAAEIAGRGAPETSRPGRRGRSTSPDAEEEVIAAIGAVNVRGGSDSVDVPTALLEGRQDPRSDLAAQLRRERRRTATRSPHGNRQDAGQVDGDSLAMPARNGR